MQNNLDYKLNRVTTVVSDMKRNLRLDDNAPIEEVSAATDLKNLINIFVQEEEPACKNGVWLQTEPFDYVDFTVDENMHIVGELEGLDKWPLETKPNKYNTGTASDSTGYYLTNSGEIYFAPYNNYTTEKWLQLSDMTIIGLYSCDGYLYVLGSKGEFRRVSLNTKEIEVLPNIPHSNSQRYYIAEVKRRLYVLISGGSIIDVFNIDTQEWTTAPFPPTHSYLKASLSGSINALPVWNGKIIVPHWTSGSGYSNYKTQIFDPETNVWSEAPSVSSMEMASLALIGNDLYAISRTSPGNLYKCDLVNNTKTIMEKSWNTDLADDVIFNCNEQLIYYSAGTRKTYTYAKDTSAYDHDTIVVVQGQYKATNYLITLYNVPETGVGNFKWPLSDVLPYINGEFKGGIPTYYGNGTEWIKFKN